MQTFKLLIATPEEMLFEGEVISATFPGIDGGFEILANHAPLISMVKEGSVQIIDKNKEKRLLAIPQGFFEFYQNKAILLGTTK